MVLSVPPTTTTAPATQPVQTVVDETKMQVESLVEHKAIDAKDTQQEIYGMAHLVAPQLKDLESRKKPLSISAVIDVSGSMGGSKLDMAKESLRFMIDELTERDELGIIAFHTDVAETIVLTKMDEQGKQRCRQAADSLRPLNCTNMSDGLWCGMDQVQHKTVVPVNGSRPGYMQHFGSGPFLSQAPASAMKPMLARTSPPPPPAPVPAPESPAPAMAPRAEDDSAPDTCRAVLLFTDGMANGGITDDTEFKQALKGRLADPKTKEMVVHTFGFGADHNANLLQGLAEIASGSYYYIQDVEIMKECFADCLGGLLSTVAQSITLDIKAAPGFSIKKVLTAYPQQEDATSGTVKVTMKDVYSEEKRDVLVQLALDSPKEPSADQASLVHFSLSYDSLISGKKETAASECKILLAEKKDEEANEIVVEQRTRIEATEAMAKARVMAERGDVHAARSYMTAQREHLSHQSNTATSTAMYAQMQAVEEAMETPMEWQTRGSKNMASVQSCQMQQRSNCLPIPQMGAVSAQSAGYDTGFKAMYRAKSKKTPQ